MADPNYVKTVAPNFAARIRAQVNTNRALRNIIQFNSAAPVLPAPALLKNWRDHDE